MRYLLLALLIITGCTVPDIQPYGGKVYKQYTLKDIPENTLPSGIFKMVVKLEQSDFELKPVYHKVGDGVMIKSVFIFENSSTIINIQVYWKGGESNE